jgi:hypothetical protein
MAMLEKELLFRHPSVRGEKLPNAAGTREPGDCRLPMSDGQAFTIGLRNLDRFAWGRRVPFRADQLLTRVPSGSSSSPAYALSCPL